MRDHDRRNLGNTERTLSMTGGSLLLINSVAAEKKSLLKAIAGGFLLYRGMTGFCPVTDSLEKGAADVSERKIRIQTGLTVNKPRNEVYAFWRELENLPLFMDHLESVQALDEKRSEWKAAVPGGMGTISWKSEIMEDQPDEVIRWRSLPGSSVENEGAIRFHEAGQYGTRILVDISYRAPLGTAGEAVLKVLNPGFEYLVKSDIHNFKTFMETGEVPTVEGQPSGRIPVE